MSFSEIEYENAKDEGKGVAEGGGGDSAIEGSFWLWIPN